MSELKPGTELYSVATGMVDVLKHKSRKAAKFMGDQDGFVAVHPVYDRSACLWFYATEADAIRARNMANTQGIVCGKNISRFIVAEDGVPEHDDEWAKAHGMGE